MQDLHNKAIVAVRRVENIYMFLINVLVLIF